MQLPAGARSFPSINASNLAQFLTLVAVQEAQENKRLSEEVERKVEGGRKGEIIHSGEGRQVERRRRRSMASNSMHDIT